MRQFLKKRFEKSKKVVLLRQETQQEKKNSRWGEVGGWEENNYQRRLVRLPRAKFLRGKDAEKEC